jgi:hypothetical protein
VNSFVPYVLLWVAMVYALTVSYWLVLPLAILATGAGNTRCIMAPPGISIGVAREISGR